MVAGVRRIDGQQGHIAQVCAPTQLGRLGRLGFRFCGFAKAHGDAVGMDGDQRGGARLVLAADHLQHPAALGAIALGRRADLGQHQVAVAHLVALGMGQDQAFLGLAVHRLDPHLAAALADHPQHLVRALAQALDHPRQDLAGLQFLKANQHPVAQARRRPGLGVAVGRQARQGRILAALDQPHEQIAVGVLLDHIGHAHGGQGAGLGEALAPAFAQRTVFLHRFENMAQGATLVAFQAELQRQIADIRLAAFAQHAHERLAVRQTLRLAVICAWRLVAGRAGQGKLRVSP